MNRNNKNSSQLKVKVDYPQMKPFFIILQTEIL